MWRKFCELEIKTIYIGILEMTLCLSYGLKETINAEEEAEVDENKGRWM